MDVCMSLNPLIRLPLSHSISSKREKEAFYFLRERTQQQQLQVQQKERQNRGGGQMVVEAKGKKGAGMTSGQFQRQQPPLPKLEDDGNPKFVIFIRSASVYLWYPLSVITGGTTAKIMVSAKDNFLGKYIYKDTIARNIAAVVYKDEKQIQKSALKQFRVLRSATAFRYGFKLVENNNLRAALSPNDVVELPPEEELKTVLDKVKDFFGDAKESFGKLTSLDATAQEEPSAKPNQKS